MKRGGRMLFIVSALGVAVLLALGSWQVHRLQWKHDLIDKRKQALTAEPVTLADIEAGVEHGFDVDWLKVQASGHFRHDLERHLYDLRQGKIGWRVLTPFVVPGRFIVMVDRGFVPDHLRDPKTRENGRAAQTGAAAGAQHSQVSLTGFVRVNAGSAGWFTPDNDVAANRWYSVDLIALAASLPENVGFVAPDGYAAMLPVLVQLAADTEGPSGKLPIVDPVKVDLPNNHLQYALTWYGLAVVLVIVSILLHRSRRAQHDEEDAE